MKEVTGSTLRAQTVWERKEEEGGKKWGNALKDTRLHFKPRPLRREEKEPERRDNMQTER